MAVLADVPHTVSATFIGTNQGRIWMNRMYWDYTSGSPDSATLFGFNNTLITNWNAAFRGANNPLVILTNVNTIDLQSRTAATAYSTVATPPVGTHTGTPLPLNVASVVSWKINNRYRGGHPRSYMVMGNLEDTVGGNAWTTAGKAILQNAATAFWTSSHAITQGGFSFVFSSVQYFSGSHKTDTNKHPDPVPVIPPKTFVIQSAVVHGRIDTQRRRLGKELV